MEKQIEVLPSPVKSTQDKKDYKTIRLPNGLQALLVSDPSVDFDILDEEEANMEEDADSEGEEEEEEEGEEEDEDDNDEEDEAEGPKSGLKKSAAGLCIKMGSFSDPKELQGLAHFLEHMVFMGSKKYPSENGFDQFVNKNGGWDNAHTDCENTTFYFEIQRKHFAKALDMFAQFFVDPLMLKTAMEREREAVDSEFQMALPSDYNRKQQIFGGLAKKDHPMGTFMWGNKESLLMGNVSFSVMISDRKKPSFI